MLASAARSACNTAWAGNVVQTWEAESGTLTAPMSVSCSGTCIDSGAHNDTNPAPIGCSTNGCSTYTFTAPVTCAYKLECLIDARSNANDTFFFEIVGTADTCGNIVALWNVNQAAGDTFVWRYVTNNNNNNNANRARLWNLTAGSSYTLRFYGREKETLLDKLRMRQNPACPVATPTPTLVATATATPTPGLGLCMGVWKSSPSFSGTPDYQSTSPVASNWGTGAPWTAAATDNFSIRWTGSFTVPSTGIYQFYIMADDKVRLFIDSNSSNAIAYINQWTSSASATTRTTIPVWLSAAGPHLIQIEYADTTAGSTAECSLSWRGPGFTWVTMPANIMVPNCAQSVATAPGVPGNTYAGLSATSRLYGLEYIPFPKQGPANDISAGGEFFDLAMTFTASTAETGADRPKNTARYRIYLNSSVVSAIGGAHVAIETRIGPNGATCSSGVYNPANYAGSTYMQLPPLPQNLSTTYFWYDNNPVPFTEQIDAVGDPRFVPYLDMFSGSTSSGTNYQHNYNWFFRNLGDNTVPGYKQSYATYASNATWDGYEGECNYDVPKLFRLWRESILRTTSIYTSMTGYDSYYAGIGGEIGGDSSNDLPSSVVLSKQPFSSGSVTGSNGDDEITGETKLVRSSSGNWRSMPTIGELWPEGAYVGEWSFAGTNTLPGNLRNPSNGGSWYRDNVTNCDIDTTTPPETHFSYFSSRHRTSTLGCETFLNGNGGSGVFSHDWPGYNAARLIDGSMMANDYNFSVDDPFAVNRPWKLNAGNGLPPEWNMAPYTSTHTNLDVYSASTVTATEWGFYQFDPTQSGVDHVNMKASAAVRAQDLSNTADVGWFIINGLAPSTTSGINYVARFALLSCLRTFHDAGVPTRTSAGVFSLANSISGVPHRIEPLPYIKIYQPSSGEDVTHQNPITLHWTERYARWDGMKYTESYPCLDSIFGNNPLNNAPCTETQPKVQNKAPLEWHGAEPLTYNIKYSTNGGGTWYSAMTGVQCSAGVKLTPTTETYNPPTSLHDHLYAWDISALAAGNKLVRVECYRQNITQHYSYHELNINTVFP